ncbi:hypothetical protein NGB36_00350 [Streptomyces sp. RB6PN25]|uniref:Uncharacterized protein n=1 Tax=Streptomyces humicola TaxID=2953240 RepID=A0ABT1PQA3_9ACTN|nr:hypothetical protein [Streptomyces humicola]MCQ4079105.1 hypothetical protein [Streptomyces humicola]
MSSHAKAQSLYSRTDVTLPLRVKRAGPVTRVLQVVVILALIPVGAFYLYPRIYNLVATPYRLDKAVVYANRYNPGLFKIVNEEQVTLQAFGALDQMNAAIARVQGVDSQVADQLRTLVGQIRGDLQATLNSADGDVSGLVSSLNALDARLEGLNPPVDGATSAVARDRATLAGILDEARATAAKVHTAREEADGSAQNVSGH